MPLSRVLVSKSNGKSEWQNRYEPSKVAVAPHSHPTSDAAQLAHGMMAADRVIRLAKNADVLPNYSWSKDLGRYRNLVNGQFVSKERITALMETHVADAENRLGKLDTAFVEGKIDASIWAESMRDEMRRLTLIQESLGGGGWQQITQRQLGRAGGELADRYTRIAANAEQFQRGEISAAQLMNRTRMMIGESRTHYWKAEKETARAQDPNGVLIERRIIQSGETCPDCLQYYDLGWQYLDSGLLPPPGEGSVCRGNCRCRVQRREVQSNDVDSWIGTKR